jgi:peptidyl-prolyl cis-trans isomerase SurA
MIGYSHKIRRVMKRKVFLCLGAAVFFLFPPLLRGEVTERIVALVNNEVITLSELEEMARPLYEQVKKNSLPSELDRKLEKAREDVLAHLVESKLLDQEIKKRKIEVPDRDVDAAIADIMKSAKMNENEFKKAIAREGMSYSVYRQRMREDLGKMRLVNREIKSKIVVEEETLRRVYRENLDKFTDPLEVKLQQIFFPLSQEASSEEVGAVRKKAEEVLEKARKGEDFADLAKKYSRGPEAAEGGLLGYFKHKELLPELEEAGFRLQVGEISKLVQTPAGFHILRVLERKGGEPKPFAEIQHRLRDQMIQAEAEKKYLDWMKDLRSKAYVEIKL